MCLFIVLGADWIVNVVVEHKRHDGCLNGWSDCRLVERYIYIDMSQHNWVMALSNVEISDVFVAQQLMTTYFSSYLHSSALQNPVNSYDNLHTLAAFSSLLDKIHEYFFRVLKVSPISNQMFFKVARSCGRRSKTNNNVLSLVIMCLQGGNHIRHINVDIVVSTMHCWEHVSSQLLNSSRCYCLQTVWLWLRMVECEQWLRNASCFVKSVPCLQPTPISVTEWLGFQESNVVNHFSYVDDVDLVGWMEQELSKDWCGEI